MTHSAINEGFAVCQARLGAKIHDAKDPASDLGPMFRQVVGTLFRLAGVYEDRWLRVRGSHAIPEYGFERVIAPEVIEVNHAKLVDNFERARLAQRAGLGRDARPRSSSSGSMSIEVPEDPASFHFPAELWIRCLYDTMVAFHRPGADREQLLAALTPLYFGRTAGFIGETLEMTTDQAERVIDAQAREFEELKPYLVARWQEMRAAASSGRLMPARRRAPYRILLPLANPRTARDLVRIGSGRQQRPATEITALGIVEVPEGVSPVRGRHPGAHARRLLQRVLDFGDEEGVEIRTMVRIGRRAADGVIEAVGEEGTDLVIFGWGGPPIAGAAAPRRRPRARRARRDASRPSSRRPSTPWCASRRATSRSSSSAAWTASRSILVPVRGGPHAELAMRLARDLGKRFGAQVVVLHVVPKGIGERALLREQEALDRVRARARRHATGARHPARGDIGPDRHHPRGGAATTWW